jgi:hypothetical protein
MRAFVLALLVAIAAAPTKSDGPLTKIKRAKVVGAPLLDLESEEGIYVWMENDGFHVAAVSRAQKNQEMLVEVRSKKKITHVDGTFAVTAGANSLRLRAWVGPLPVRGRFKSDGEVTVRSAHQIFVGPYAKKAASTVAISR